MLAKICVAALLLAIAVCVAPLSAVQAGEANSPAGLWRTFDDHTGEARGLVRIYEQNGAFYGKIEQSFTPGAENRVCTACDDERKNQPMIGLVIMRHVAWDDDEYTGGDILDPDTGSVYRCKFQLQDSGQKLRLRGYLGISLLGRSQIWERVE
jgi:uncharacterized protein (DUF2147 family)